MSERATIVTTLTYDEDTAQEVQSNLGDDDLGVIHDFESGAYLLVEWEEVREE